MLKLLDIDPIFFGEEPSITILNFDVAGRGLTKRAADSRIDSYISQLKPESNKIYVHILAMGAGEYFGANRNADYFPEENLIKYHETFATSPAHIFKHHINKNPDIAIGKVIYSVYNDRMHRVEVIAWVDKDRGFDYVQRIERGEFPATSMACHTPFDTCSICGNKAKSRSEYCTHLRNELGKILPNGQKVMAINDGPLRFFDMSFVFKPADVTSSVLQKVALYQDMEKVSNEVSLSSIENAELNGLVEKAAEIKKLSELIKEIEGEVVANSNSLQDILARVKDPDDDVLHTLIKFDLHHIIHALADLGISPSVSFFAKLIGQKITGVPVDGIQNLVSGLLMEDVEKLNVPRMTLQKQASEYFAPSIKKALTPFVKTSSLFPGSVIERSFMSPEEKGFGPMGGMGYAGNGPEVIPDPKEMYRQHYLALRQAKGEENQGLLKTLFLIGGAAVAAKWLLSQIIESKMKQHMVENRQQPVKIVLVKSASEAFSTTQLVKAAFLKDLTQN
jgi:hypothetical protein